MSNDENGQIPSAIRSLRQERRLRSVVGTGKDLSNYLIGETLVAFAAAAERDAAFARELPRFLFAIWRIFNRYELVGYVTSRKPAVRARLRSLLYVR